MSLPNTSSIKYGDHFDISGDRFPRPANGPAHSTRGGVVTPGLTAHTPIFIRGRFEPFGRDCHSLPG